MSSTIHDFGFVHSYFDLASCTEQGITLVIRMHLGVAHVSEPTMATAPLLKVPAEVRIVVHRLLLTDHKDMFSTYVRKSRPHTSNGSGKRDEEANLGT